MSRTIHYIYRLVAAVLFLTVVYGCMNEVALKQPAGEENCYVRMQIRVPAIPTQAARAGGYTDTHIKTLDVLSFREDNYLYQYRSKAGAIDTDNQWFDVVLTKSQDEKQVLVVIANLREELDNFLFIPGTTTLEEVRNTFAFDIIHQSVYDATHDPANRVEGQFGANRPLPMWGQSEPVTLLDDQVTLGTIFMLRSLASVTVMINLNPDDAAQRPFELVDVVITNTPDKGLTIPAPSHIDTAANGYITANQPTTGLSGVTYGNAYYTSTDGVSIASGIYIGESSNTTSGMTDNDRTWLLIGGKYDNSPDVTWYRLPFIDTSGKQWDILRNHNYIFNITKVTGSGNTEEEAKENNIFADVIPWNLGTDAVFDIEGIYWIWIDPTTASFDVHGGEGTVTVETNYPGGWTATVSGSETDRDTPCTWLTIDPASSGSILKYTVSQTDEWTPRSGYLHLRAGGFAVTVRIDQSHLYITDKNVSPAGNIDSRGESRTAGFVGLFDDIRVRVWDATNGVELVQTPEAIATGTLTTGNSGSSVTVAIPAWSSGVNRTVRIQYYDKAQNSWVTIQESIQEGYNFTVGSTLTDGSVINTSNQSYTINISGTAWPTIYARAIIRGTQHVVGGPITINSGTTSGSITIATYEQWNDPSLNRIVELQWSRSNTDWSGATTLNYGSQPGAFQVTGSNVEIPGIKYEGYSSSIIPLLGDVLGVTVSGTFNTGWVQLRAIEVSTDSPQASTSTPEIASGTKANLEIGRNPNYNKASATKYPGLSDYAGHRNIRCQYRRKINSTTGGAAAWETTWNNIGTEIEQLGYVTLKCTGRVVAGQDMMDASGNPLFVNWATAMGIASKYNTTYYAESGFMFHNLNNPWQLVENTFATLYYSTDYSAGNGGCAAYTEPGVTKPFYLPTHTEMKEMNTRYQELGQIAYEDPYDYWVNTQAKVQYDNTTTLVKDPATAGVTFDLEYGVSNQQTPSKTFANRVRCIRGK